MIVPVILAGGKGERFWPLSKEGRPKQLVKFGERTLLEEAYLRAKLLGEPILVLTSKEIEAKVRELLPEAEVVAEPVGKNTAPACYYAARWALREVGDATLVVMPSDHVIKDREGFARTARFAARLAEEAYLVTFGVKPTRPETGYGYIERGEPLLEEGELKAYRALKFHEKPKREVAEEYLRSGRFYWNSGMFVWKARVFAEAVERYAPEVARALPEDLDLERFYGAAPSISVDYAVMEHAERLAVVEARFDWEDAGSFASLFRVFPADERGNVRWGEAVVIDVENSVLVAEGGVVAALGVEGLVVVHTPDVTLVLPVSEAQRVKELLHKFKEEKGE